MFLSGHPQIDVTTLPDELHGRFFTDVSGAVNSEAVHGRADAGVVVRKLLGTAYSAGAEFDEELGKVCSVGEVLAPVDCGPVFEVLACC